MNNQGVDGCRYGLKSLDPEDLNKRSENTLLEFGQTTLTGSY